MNEKKFVITGGGTGGHVFPALSIAEEMRRRGFVPLYVGTAHGMEAKLVPPRGIAFFTLKTGAVKNQSLLKIFKTLLQLSAAVVWSIGFLRRQRPVAVLGVGGYVSVPICVAAFLLRIPLYLQEQNASVGIANRFLGRLSRTIFLGFEEAKACFNPKKCIVSGNPIRPEIGSDRFNTYIPEPRHLLIFGGSQGAKAINDAVLAVLIELQSKFPQLSVKHQTGRHDEERVRNARPAALQLDYQVVPFIDDMASAYEKASLVVCRSGALTVSELMAVKRPSLLVPFPRKGQNDQTANAYWMEKQGLARVVEQGEDFLGRFRSALFELLAPKTLAEMTSRFSTLHPKASLVTIGDQIERDLGLKK